MRPHTMLGLILPDALVALSAAFRVVIALLALRMFPTVIAFSAAPDCPAKDRAIAVAGYTGIAYLALRYAAFSTSSVLIAYAYLGTTCLIPYFTIRLLNSRIRLFFLSFGLFLFLPGIFQMPSGIALLLGSEIAFSVYSYCIATRKQPTSLGDYLFFVLVNPVLVYSQRGVIAREVGLHSVGLLRVLRGSGALLTSGAIASLSIDFLPGPESVVARPLLRGVLRLGELYFAHTGLAALQIGLMQQLGRSVPERYLGPLRATSPKDFWRRWNTYITSWVRIYFFQPLALYLRRTTRRSLASRVEWIAPVAVLASFGFVGLFHDAYSALAAQHVQLVSTRWFLMNGMVLIACEIVASSVPDSYCSRRWRKAAGHVTVLGLAVAFASKWG